MRRVSGQVPPRTHPATRLKSAVARLDTSQMGIVIIKTQTQARVHLSAFRPGCLTKHR